MASLNGVFRSSLILNKQSGRSSVDSLVTKFCYTFVGGKKKNVPEHGLPPQNKKHCHFPWQVSYKDLGVRLCLLKEILAFNAATCFILWNLCSFSMKLKSLGCQKAMARLKNGQILTFPDLPHASPEIGPKSKPQKFNIATKKKTYLVGVTFSETSFWGIHVGFRCFFNTLEISQLAKFWQNPKKGKPGLVFHSHPFLQGQKP